MTTRLPVVLENLRIATPCQADWDEMGGDERVRFCGRCEKNVYNLSAMTRAEAEALVGNQEGRVCVRLYQRRDGTVLTADCPVGVRRERLRARIWSSVSGLAASAALLLGLVSGRARADLTLRDGKKVAQQTRPNVLMGGPVSTHFTPPPPAPPKPLQVKMGERIPEAFMGDISVEPATK